MSLGEAAPFAIETVAVIGAGRLGRSFALTCAAAGFEVVLEDVMPANLRRAQEEYAELRVASGGGSLRVALTVEDAVRAADVAVDFVPDELESKLEIFSLVDRMGPPKTILLTPSDALSITDLASCTYRGDRCFAVRGGLVSGGPVRVVYPRRAAAEALDAVREFFQRLGSEARVAEDAEEPMLVKNVKSGDVPAERITLREFQTGDEAAFKRLNEEWITRFFALEPKDEYSLDHPRKTILDTGGRIFFALLDGVAVGCCALMAMGAGEFEVAKMAVTDSAQGQGVGRRLLAEVVAQARADGATRLYLETNSKLTPAIRLYESLGFEHLPPARVVPSPYARANVYMEMYLKA